MDWFTLAIGVFVLLSGISAFVWQLYSLFYSSFQWYSPHDKTILITGCDSGIGNQLAKHFHGLGAIVLATVLDKNSTGAQRLREECGEERLRLIEMNVTNDNDVDKAFLYVQNYLNECQITGLYALINNAGVCVMGEFDWLTWPQIQSVIDVNLLGTIRVTKTFLPLIIQAKGRIINVSSVNGSVAYPGISVYCATKFGIEGLSEALRLEVSKFGVQVIVVKPGDYARLTNIVNNHERDASQMWQLMDHRKRKLYSNYFDQFNSHVQKNYGLTSPPSFEKSTLFSDFEESVLAVNPRYSIISAPLIYRIFFNSLHILPNSLKVKLLSFIFSKVFKFDVNCLE